MNRTWAQLRVERTFLFTYVVSSHGDEEKKKNDWSFTAAAFEIRWEEHEV